MSVLKRVIRLSKDLAHWHAAYARMRGWARKGVLARMFEAMEALQIIAIKVDGQLAGQHFGEDAC